MTARGSQTLTWDVENRLASVSGGAAFGYDGDGVRVRRTEGGETMVYPNRFYEKNLTTGTATKHYYLGGELINVRRGSTWESVHRPAGRHLPVRGRTAAGCGIPPLRRRNPAAP